MTQAPVSATKSDRLGYLDFYRGFTVVQMVAAHLLMHSVAPMKGDQTARLFLFSYAELFSAGFLMLAGANVGLIVSRLSRIPGFDTLRFFAYTAFGLYVMGWSYNLLEGSGPFTSVVQAIGVGVLAAYLLYHARVPTWAFAVFGLGFIGAYYLAVAAVIEVDPSVRANFAWHMLAGHGEVTREALDRLYPHKYWFCMFGIVPTCGYVILGAFIERLRGGWLIAFCALCLVLALVSHVMPEMTYNARTHMVLRMDLKFFVQILPLYTGWLLTFRYLYPRRVAGPFARMVEGFGRLSLDFLIFHWIFIGLFTLTTPFLDKGPLDFAAVQWIRTAMVLAALWWTLPRFDAYRKRVSGKPGFLRRSWIILLTAYAVAIVTSAMPVLRPVRIAAGVIAALVFIRAYPAARDEWRRRCTPARST